jgi:putative transposase
VPAGREHGLEDLDVVILHVRARDGRDPVLRHIFIHKPRFPSVSVNP